MKDRTITYRGVQIEVVEFKTGEPLYRHHSGELYNFSEVCDLIDEEKLAEVMFQFDNLEHLSRSERVRRDLVGKEVVVGFKDGFTRAGVLETLSQDFCLNIGEHVMIISSEDIDNSKVVVKAWSVLTIDQKSLFVDLNTWGGELRATKAEVVRCENKVDELFNLIKNI